MADTLRCPWCGSFVTLDWCEVGDENMSAHFWTCQSDRSCGARGPLRPTRDEAIATLADVKREHPVLESAVAYAIEQRIRADNAERELAELNASVIAWVESGLPLNSNQAGYHVGRPNVPSTDAEMLHATAADAVLAWYRGRKS